MNHKLRPQRLSQLYADIDLPVFDPAGHTLQIRQASESLPSQVESQSSDVILLPEKNQMDFADSHAAADVLGVATVSMSTHTIPAPITSQAGIDAELQAAPPLGRPLKTDEPQTDWKAVGIGVVTGTAVSGLILVATFPMHILIIQAGLPFGAGKCSWVLSVRCWPMPGKVRRGSFGGRPSNGH